MLAVDDLSLELAAGEVVVDGEPLSTTKRFIGYVPQELALHPDLARAVLRPHDQLAATVMAILHPTPRAASS